MSKNVFFWSFAIATCFTLPYARAELINYTFENGTTPTITGANSAQLSSTFKFVGDSLINQGVQLGAGNNFQAFSGIWRTFAMNSTSAAANGDANSIGHGIQFDLTIAPGYKFDMTGMGWTTFNGSAGSSTSGGLRSAISSAGTGSTAIQASWGYPGWSNSAGNSDTSSGYGNNGRTNDMYFLGSIPQFQGLTGTKKLNLTIWQENTTGTFGNWYGIDNVFFQGTVTAVPEPSSMALVGLAGAAGGAWFRRRRSIRKPA